MLRELYFFIQKVTIFSRTDKFKLTKINIRPMLIRDKVKEKIKKAYKFLHNILSSRCCGSATFCTDLVFLSIYTVTTLPALPQP